MDGQFLIQGDLNPVGGKQKQNLKEKIMDDKIKVELLRYPSEEAWAWVKTCTLNTVGKESTKAPTDEWKRKLLRAEHSPIRELWFGFRLTVPYWVSVH